MEWQLLVASGAALPLPQDQLRIGGHAIEARVYAEDPDRDFMPAVGTLTHLQPRSRTRMCGSIPACGLAMPLASTTTR